MELYLGDLLRESYIIQVVGKEGKQKSNKIINYYIRLFEIPKFKIYFTTILLIFMNSLIPKTDNSRP